MGVLILQYVHYNLPTSALNPIDVWTDYPHNPLAGPVKLYYLLQTAFYTHQILVINAEARRKDHWQMLGHHFITVPLMVGSYFYNYTRVGCLIMFLMDWSDIFLPVSTSKYNNSSRLTQNGRAVFTAGEDDSLLGLLHGLRSVLRGLHGLMAHHAAFLLRFGNQVHLGGEEHHPAHLGPLTRPLYDQRDLLRLLRHALRPPGKLPSTCLFHTRALVAHILAVAPAAYVVLDGLPSRVPRGDRQGRRGLAERRRRVSLPFCVPRPRTVLMSVCSSSDGDEDDAKKDD